MCSFNANSNALFILRSFLYQNGLKAFQNTIGIYFYVNSHKMDSSIF
nr:MAG TPA: hypothetical protein [Caudoviricetes sp.]